MHRPETRQLQEANLTHIRRIDFHTRIKLAIPFPFFGLLGGIFHFHSNFDRTFCRQTVETLIRRHVLSGCVLFVYVKQKGR